MKKVDIIFDDITILNFRFFWKLLKRYYYFLVITPLVVSGISYHFYKSQHEIYISSVSFKTIENTSGNSASNAIASLIGEKTSSITPAEVEGIAYSVNFLQSLSEKVYKSEEFYNLNFNSIYAQKLISTKDKFAHCGDDESCINASLRGILGSFFTIKRDQEIFSKFYVKVKTLDNFTTKFLVNLLMEEINEYRINTIKHTLGAQKKLSEKLIDEKRYGLEANDVEELLQKKKALLSTRFELQQKLEVHGDTLRREKFKLEEVTAKHKQSYLNKKNIKLSTHDYEVWKRLRDKLKDLNDDIYAVSHVSDGNLDRVILSKLEKNRLKVLEDLKKFRVSRSVSSGDFEGFDGNKVAHYEKFNVDVVKEQVENLETTYNELFKTNEVNESKIESIETEIEKHKPNLKYLELLNQKKMQISLLESTVISDFIFDKLATPVSIFKRNSPLMIVLFSFIITVFLLVLFVMIRFFFDSRVFDEEELASNFKNLEIIGNTPEFN